MNNENLSFRHFKALEKLTLVFPIPVNAQNCKAEVEQYLENYKKLVPNYKGLQVVYFWNKKDNF